MLNVAVYVRSAGLNRLAQIDEVIGLECVERHLGLGAWTVDLPFSSAAADAMIRNPGSGIEVRQAGRVVFGGRKRAWKRTRTSAGDTLTVVGVDDMFALASRLVHPEPSSIILEPPAVNTASTLAAIAAAGSIAAVEAAVVPFALAYGLDFNILEASTTIVGIDMGAVASSLAHVKASASAIVEELAKYPREMTKNMRDRDILEELWLVGDMDDGVGVAWGFYVPTTIFVSISFTADIDVIRRVFNHEMGHAIAEVSYPTTSAAYQEMAAVNHPDYPYGGGWIASQASRPPGYLDDAYSWSAVEEDFAEIFGRQMTLAVRQEAGDWAAADSILARKFAAVARVVATRPGGQAFPWVAGPPVASHSTFSGPASTVIRSFIDVNVGPSAVVDRRWPELTMAADPAEGPSITVSGRWQNLLEHVASVAQPNGVSVLVRQVDGGVVCTVRVSRDRTNIELSPRSGTLEGWTVDSAAPEMTAGWAGGQGELSDRLIDYDSNTPPADWPERVERFIDHRNQDDPAELERVLAEALVEGAAKDSLTLVPSSDLDSVYGLDFDLGDTVTVLLEGVRSEQIVSSATLRIGEDGVASRTFTVGPEKPSGMGALFDQMRDLRKRLRNLEGN